jgi:hypothetical protein
VIQVYATTTTDRNSLVIVLDRAKYGDLKSFYNTLIDKFNVDRKVSTWDYKFNRIDNEHVLNGIESMLPWGVVSAADRMMMVL